MSPNTTATLVPIRSKPVEAELQQATDQPTRMANQQESQNQRTANQLELALNLNHSTRDQLITSLNQLSSLLQCNKPIPGDTKQRTCKKIDDAILSLAKLSPFATQSTNVSGAFEETISDQLIVELSRVERLRVIGHLTSIKDAVLFDDLFTDETKSSLVTENRSIIHRLLDLPLKEQSDRSDEDKNESKNERKNERNDKRNDKYNDEPLSKQQMVESEISGQNEVLDWKSQIASLQTRMEDLKSELRSELKSKLKPVIEKVNVSRAKVSFRFELADLRKFFEIDRSVSYSDRFWCRGLQWSLYAKRKTQDDSKYLGLYLRCHNDDPAGFCCHVDFNLILFNHLPGQQNLVLEFSYVFRDGIGQGSPYLIGYRELTDQSGYIKNDRILLGVELKAGPVVRE